MAEQWVNFAVLIFVQLILFIAHAIFLKRIAEVPKLLAYGAVAGVILGIPFDLLFGKYLGFYSYELGFDIGFLAINGVLSFGIAQANVLFMQRASLAQFYIWTLFIGGIYELTNFYFRVWNWEFSTSLKEFYIVHGVGYLILMSSMACIWHVFFKRHFSFIKNVFRT